MAACEGRHYIIFFVRKIDNTGLKARCVAFAYGFEPELVLELPEVLELPLEPCRLLSLLEPLRPWFKSLWPGYGCWLISRAGVDCIELVVAAPAGSFIIVPLSRSRSCIQATKPAALNTNNNFFIVLQRKPAMRFKETG